VTPCPPRLAYGVARYQSLDRHNVNTGPKCYEITKLINRHTDEIGSVVTTHNGKMVRRQSSR